MSCSVISDPVSIDIPKDSDFNIYRTEESEYPPIILFTVYGRQRT